MHRLYFTKKKCLNICNTNINISKKNKEKLKQFTSHIKFNKGKVKERRNKREEENSIVSAYNVPDFIKFAKVMKHTQLTIMYV